MFLKRWGERYEGRVRVCNNVRHMDVPRDSGVMNMMVAPSQTTRNWREQFGRMLIESFACGVPVVGSDSGEYPYRDRDVGLVCGERDHHNCMGAGVSNASGQSIKACGTCAAWIGVCISYTHGRSWRGSISRFSKR